MSWKWQLDYTKEKEKDNERKEWSQVYKQL